MGNVGREEWLAAFFRIMQSPEFAKPLREAAANGRLKVWTEHLTRLVVQSCGAFGWRATAKGHLAGVLPVARHEYLALDVVAFPGSQESQWPFPVAVFELENSPEDERVSYSLWKVLCVRTLLRVVFAYRRGSAEGTALMGYLASSVVGSLSIPERKDLSGETMVIVGSRAERDTFPYGYFKTWILDTNTGRFIRG
jgi:hypothetical protein